MNFTATMEYARLGLEGAPGVLKNATAVVDETTNLVQATQNLGNGIAEFVNQTIEGIDLLEHKEIKNNSRAIAVIENIVRISDIAFAFVKSLDSLFWFGQNEQKIQHIKDAISENKNFQPLCEHVKELETCLSQAEKHYAEFQKECEEAKTNCLEVAEDCKHKEVDARSKKIATKAVGGTAAGVTMAAGIGTGVTLSVIAGAFTFGIGTIVGLVITGASAAVAGTAIGAGTATATHFLARSFEQIQATFAKLADHFESLRKITSGMQRSIRILKSDLQRLEDSIENVQRFHKEHSKDSIYRALDCQYKQYTESYAAINLCHQQLKSQRATLHQKFKVN